MKDELIYNHQCGQDWIKEMVDYSPSARKFYEMVAGKLNCNIEDLALIEVNSDFQEVDDEGWRIKSFFPTNALIKIKIISEDYAVDDFAVGEVIEITYGDEKFIGESDASPWGVWGKLPEERGNIRGCNPI